MTDQFEDVLLLYPDTISVSALFPCRQMKYKSRDEKLVTDAWLDMHISRNMLKNNKSDMYANVCVF